MKCKKSLKFQTKLFLTCLLISLIPTLVLGTFCYAKIHEMLIERERLALRQSISRESVNISSQLKSYATITEHIVWDTALTRMLKGTYEKNSEMFSAYTQQMEPLFQTIKYLSPEIDSLLLYTNLNIYPRNGVLEPLDNVTHQAWYAEVSQQTMPVWIYSEQELAIVQRFPNTPRNVEALIYIALDKSPIFSSLSTLYTQAFGVMCADPDVGVIWEYHADDLESDALLMPDQLETWADGVSQQYIVETTKDPYTGWTYYIYRPARIVLEPTESIITTVFALVLLCLMSVFAFSSYFSRHLVKPLEQLAQNMNSVSQGDYQVNVSPRTNDEVGQLILVFTDMVRKLNELINETLRSKIIQQKLEFRALQAQINPHFLYNTLSLINSQALMTGHPEIGLPARYLATFYRTSLNKGNDLILIRDEIENIKAYINIQLIMHTNSFAVEYDIPEAFLNDTMPNLMLQPLVENAIVHGFDESEQSRPFRLSVSLREKDHKLIFTISDNGCGIAPHILENILTRRSRGYGVENVHARAQLQYGGSYGVSYRTCQGEGTTAILTLPRTSVHADPPATNFS